MNIPNALKTICFFCSGEPHLQGFENGGRGAKKGGKGRKFDQ